MMADRKGLLWQLGRLAGGVLFVFLVLMSSVCSVVSTVPPIFPLALLRPSLFAWLVEWVGWPVSGERVFC